MKKYRIFLCLLIMSILFFGVSAQEVSKDDDRKEFHLFCLASANKFFESGQIKNGFNLIDGLLEKEPNLSGYIQQCVAFIAEQCHQREQSDEALKILDHLLLVYPKCERARFDRASLYCYKGLFEKALEDCNILINDFPAVADMWYLGGAAYYGLSNYEECIKYETESLSIKPNAQAFSVRGNAYLLLGKVELAASDFEHGMKLTFPSKSDYLKLAVSYMLMGNYLGSADIYEKVIQLDDSDIGNYVGRIYSLIKAGMYQQASDESEVVISRFPESSYGYFYKGLSLIMIGKPKSAQEKFSVAIQKDQSSGYYYAWRGLANLAIGKNKSSFNDLKKAVRLDGNSSFAYKSRGLFYMKQEEREKALSDLEKCLSLLPNDDYAKSLKTLAETLQDSELKNIKVLSLLPDDEIGMQVVDSVINQVAEQR